MFIICNSFVWFYLLSLLAVIDHHQNTLPASMLTLSGLAGGGKGGGGAQRPGWPSSQLPIRNLLLYDSQTWWILVFILKTCSDQILAKMVNQEVAAALFSLRHAKNVENEKKFPLLENCWNWHGGSILVREKRFWTLKLIYLKLNPFSRGK